MHDINLVTTVAVGLTAALVLGLTARRLGLSPIVGYLLAGIVVGPHTPGFAADTGLATQLAEIGVILLMFGVGLHFHFSDLMAVRSIAITGALGQSLVATVCGLGVALAAGWTVTGGLVLGIAVSVASTVVLLRVLAEHNLVEATEGRVAVGWLVVEDIITVLVLVLLPALGAPAGEGGSIWAVAGIAVLKLSVLSALVAFVGTRFVPRLLLRVARLRSSELFTLTVLVIAVGVATVGYTVFGASMALGAFLAGMVVGQSKVSHQAAADALPMRDAFAVLFFVSVGMLFDVRAVLHEPWLVAGLLAVILLVKPLIALVIVLVSGRSLRIGLTVAGGLAQIGEFSFILAALGTSLKILPEAGHHAIVAAALISISLNPFLFEKTLQLEVWLQKFPRVHSWLEGRDAKRGAEFNQAHPISDDGPPRAIVVGYGPVGRAVTRRIKELHLEPLVIDMNIDTVLGLQADGERALFGDATKADILREAGATKAAYLIVTIPDTAVGVAVSLAARELSRELRIYARSRHSGNAEMFERAGVVSVCYDEAEVATALTVVLQADIKAAGLDQK